MTHLDVVYLSREGTGPWTVHASSFAPEVQRRMGYRFDKLMDGTKTMDSGGQKFRMTAIGMGGAETSQASVVVAKSYEQVMASFGKLGAVSGGLILFSIVISVLATRRVTYQVVSGLDEVVYQDSLTGLANRRLFDMNLLLCEQNLRGLGRGFTVMVMDLNKFKAVNDTLGHAAGDQVLREAAQRIKSVVRKSDTVARLGGDEFALLLMTNDRHKASEVAAQIVGRVREPMTLANGTLASVGVSIGIVRAPAGGEDAAALLELADAAMYAAKAGRRGFAFAPEASNAVQTEEA